jgi:Ion transport protein
VSLIHGRFTFYYVLYLVLITISNYNSSAGWCRDRDGLGNRSMDVVDGFIICFNALFFWVEVRQVHKSSAINYISEPFNCIQLTVCTLIFIGEIRRLLVPCDNSSKDVMIYATVLAFVNLLYYFRPYRRPGLLVRMIIYITWEVKWMVLIMFIVVFGFSPSFYLISYNNGSATSKYFDRANSVLQAYTVVAGSPDFEGNNITTHC